jgi:hypothetical protein
LGCARVSLLRNHSHENPEWLLFPPSVFSGLKPSPLTMRRHWADNGLRFHEL